MWEEEVVLYMTKVTKFDLYKYLTIAMDIETYGTFKFPKKEHLLILWKIWWRRRRNGPQRNWRPSVEKSCSLC